MTLLGVSCFHANIRIEDTSKTTRVAFPWEIGANTVNCIGVRGQIALGTGVAVFCCQLPIKGCL